MKYFWNCYPSQETLNFYIPYSTLWDYYDLVELIAFRILLFDTFMAFERVFSIFVSFYSVGILIFRINFDDFFKYIRTFTSIFKRFQAYNDYYNLV